MQHEGVQRSVRSDSVIKLNVLYSFQPGVSVGWEIFRMKEELEAIFNRNVDLVRKEAIQKSKNPYRKQEILDSYEVIHEQD